MPRSTCAERRRGQAISFVLMALVVLFFVFLWSADLHRAVSAKDRSQNAGDAAALAAARWQAVSLNLMGELTLVHALALAVGDDAAASLVTNTQARLCFTGPMTAFAAAQQGAALNGVPANEGFAELVRQRAAVVRHGYGASVGDSPTALDEPYPGAWEEYAAMLDAVVAGGVAAGADNAVFYTDAAGGHVLLDEGFYDAVAGRTWCWFHLHEPKLLSSYTGPSWWPPLPEPAATPPANAEFYSLRLASSWKPLRTLAPAPVLAAAAEAAGRPISPVAFAERDFRDRGGHLWFVYHGPEWGAWEGLADPFPVSGRVRAEFDYEGADAVARVETPLRRFSPGPGDDDASVVWTAAAKPFGCLDADGERTPPCAYGLVLPAFRDVRLMPVDASTGGAGGSFKLGWRRHVAEHLAPYLRGGLSALRGGCWYCRQLRRWEDDGFRREGVEWLRDNAARCTISGPGPGDHGGTGHAH